MATGFGVDYSLDGQQSGNDGNALEGLSPKVATTARNLVVEVDAAAPTFTREREFSLVVDGYSLLGCTIPAQASSCNTGTATAAIPAGSRLRFAYRIGGTGSIPPDVVAR
jgi:hypothetical protein